MSKQENINFFDTTFRDGMQSLWAMRMSHGMFDAVAQEMDQAGFLSVEVPAHPPYFKLAVRNFKEDPWETMRIFKEKMPNSKKAVTTGTLVSLDVFSPPQPASLIKLWHERTIEAIGVSRYHFVSNTRDEIIRLFPTRIPMMRELGQEIWAALSYAVSPRHTDEYYAELTKKVMKFKLDGIYIKDQCGLLTPERLRTLLPIIIENAEGLPVEVHTHGMSTFSGAVVVEAMKLGASGIHTCVPPLANGSSHPSIFNVLQNARLLGLKTNINEETLKVAEERLTSIARLENLPIGTPLQYNHGVYTHQVPGGVISNLVAQLQQLGIAHKLDEVLEEVVRIIKDLGYPIMITPLSQFIVSQAAVNVALGERYKEILDCMIEFAVGVYGIEDSGVLYMDQNVKDRFLGSSRAKGIAQKWAKRQEEAAKEVSIDAIRREYGFTGGTDEDFLLFVIMKGDEEIKKIRESGPPRKYYTGKEPLGLLLHELGKDYNISRLEIRR